MVITDCVSLAGDPFENMFFSHYKSNMYNYYWVELFLNVGLGCRYTK